MCSQNSWFNTAYVEDIQIKVQIGMQHFRQEFTHLTFDAYHEANYAMGKMHSSEECIKLGETYDKDEAICTNYLVGGLTTESNN